MNIKDTLKAQYDAGLGYYDLISQTFDIYKENCVDEPPRNNVAMKMIFYSDMVGKILDKTGSEIEDLIEAGRIRIDYVYEYMKIRHIHLPNEQVISIYSKMYQQIKINDYEYRICEDGSYRIFKIHPLDKGAISLHDVDLDSDNDYFPKNIWEWTNEHFTMMGMIN